MNPPINFPSQMTAAWHLVAVQGIENCFTVRKTLPNYVSFELPLPTAWNYSLSLLLARNRLGANYIELYYDCCVPTFYWLLFLLHSLRKKKSLIRQLRRAQSKTRNLKRNREKEPKFKWASDLPLCKIMFRKDMTIINQVIL